MCFDLLKRAWRIYIKNITSFLGAFIFLFSLSLFFATLIFFSLWITNYSSSNLLHLTSLSNRALRIIVPIVLLAILVIRTFSLGIYAMAFESFRKRRTKLQTLFRAVKERWIEFLVANIVMGVIYTLLIAFLVLILLPILYLSILAFLISFIVAFLLLSVFFTFVFPAVADKKNIAEALSLSIKKVRKYYTEVLGLLIFFVIISILVSNIPYIGIMIILFVIYPLAFISFAYLYRKMK